MTNSDSLNEFRYSVYKHTSPNGKVYIGMTGLKPEYRWNNGKGYLNSNAHFRNAIKKYGWDNFKHEVVYTNLDKETACAKEVELIKFYDSTNPAKGYNITTGGEVGYCVTFISEATRKKHSEASSGENNPMYGKHHTEEARKKISQNRHYLRGKEHPGYGKPLPEYLATSRLRPVVQLDKNGQFVAEYSSETEAATITGISDALISGCCNKKHLSAGGFIWVFQSEYDPNLIYTYQRQTNGRPVVQLDTNYTFINEYPSIKAAEENTGVSHHVNDCCRGIRKKCGGFYWMYKEDYIAKFNQKTKESYYAIDRMDGRMDIAI